ncbi:hypothetical protein BSKO_04168 [Bryopsis sp. KO-2023]|nr:hypothetical protein BSKO_04168 [Bryopsis sp. KO-2023]
MWRRVAGRAALLFRGNKAAQHTFSAFPKATEQNLFFSQQRDAAFAGRGAVFCASLMWRKLTVPAIRRWSSSEGNGSSYLFPPAVAAFAAALIPFGASAEGIEEDEEEARRKLMELLEGQKGILGPGSSLWIPPNNIHLVKVLNEGNFGKIWVGQIQDSSGSQEVAVKLISGDDLRQGGLAELLKCEAEVFHRVSTRCHHVCRLYGITWKGDHLCLIMKLYKKSLSQLLREHGGGMPLGEIKKYGLQVCKGLVELHDQGVIMQDLKPANVLIDDLDNAVLADFGMASFVDRVKGSVVVTAAKGTPSYMPPEAWDPAAKGGMSTKSDIWSLACVILELVTGRPPWHCMELSAISSKVKDVRETPVIPKGLPVALDEVLRRSFSYDGQNRPDSREILKVFMEEWEVTGKITCDDIPVGVDEGDEVNGDRNQFSAPIEQASFYSFIPFSSEEEKQQSHMKELYQIDKDLYRAVDRLSHLIEVI